jgi:hypothetical protein
MASLPRKRSCPRWKSRRKTDSRQYSSRGHGRQKRRARFQRSSRRGRGNRTARKNRPGQLDRPLCGRSAQHHDRRADQGVSIRLGRRRFSGSEIQGRAVTPGNRRRMPHPRIRQHPPRHRRRWDANQAGQSRAGDELRAHRAQLPDRRRCYLDQRRPARWSLCGRGVR